MARDVLKKGKKLNADELVENTGLPTFFKFILSSITRCVWLNVCFLEVKSSQINPLPLTRAAAGKIKQNLACPFFKVFFFLFWPL
jgi:hypothetical protein